MVILANKLGHTDGSAHNLLQKLNTDTPIVLVSRTDDFAFNEELLDLKDYALMDFVELGYDWHREFGHKWGINTDKFSEVFKGEEWKKFDEFVKNHPPKITFQREVLKEDVTDKLIPVVYACFLPAYEVQPESIFNARPVEVFFNWGLSHEYRKTLHGNIWIEAGKHGYSVCDNISHLVPFIQAEKSPRWVTVNTPYYARFPMETVMQVNQMAKVSISIAGAGRNCFRHSEAPVNSVMLMWDDNTAWHQEDWVHGINCLKCEQGKEIETAIDWLKKPKELYSIYVKGVETVDKFRFENYVPYLENIINSK